MRVALDVIRDLDLGEIDFCFLAHRQRHLISLVHIENKRQIIVRVPVSLVLLDTQLQVLHGEFVICHFEVRQAKIIIQLSVVCLLALVLLDLQLAAPVESVQGTLVLFLFILCDAKVEEALDTRACGRGL